MNENIYWAIAWAAAMGLIGIYAEWRRRRRRIGKSYQAYGADLDAHAAKPPWEWEYSPAGNVVMKVSPESMPIVKRRVADGVLRMVGEDKVELLPVKEWL